MSRLYTECGRWFDTARAERWAGHSSELWRTAKKAWVLAPSGTDPSFLHPEEARQWLLAEGYEQDAQRRFPPAGGRPEHVEIRLTPAERLDLEKWAARNRETLSGALRRAGLEQARK